jgi:hypothetical protein
MQCACATLPSGHVWLVLFHNIFPHFLINVTSFGGRGGGEEREIDTEHKMRVFISSTNFA